MAGSCVVDSIHSLPIAPNAPIVVALVMDETTPPSPNSQGHDVTVCPSTVTPEKLLRLMNDDEWEQFVLEWTEGFAPKYPHVDRIGGAGDKGWDVVG